MNQSKSGYVYLLLYPDGYKIGRSKKPWQRRKQLQGVHIERIYHVCSIFTHDAVALERELHEKYCAVRCDKREYFKLSDEQAAEIMALKR